MRQMSATLISVMFLLTQVLSVGAENAAGSKWEEAVGDLGGQNWADHGIWFLAAVPDRDEVIAAFHNMGLWKTGDGGTTWQKLGAPEKGIAVQMVFDPKNPDAFWASGMYGFGIWKTTDGGKTFEKLGALDHVDGIGVDFSDPERKTLLVGLHEKVRSTHRSTDGGKTWENIGGTLPEKSNHSTQPIAIDGQTYITSAAGWLPNTPWGIYRTTDGGKTWDKVSDFGPGGNPMIASDGTIYWQVLWDMKPIRSKDKGLT